MARGRRFCHPLCTMREPKHLCACGNLAQIRKSRANARDFHTVFWLAQRARMYDINHIPRVHAYGLPPAQTAELQPPGAFTSTPGPRWNGLEARVFRTPVSGFARQAVSSIGRGPAGSLAATNLSASPLKPGRGPGGLLATGTSVVQATRIWPRSAQNSAWRVGPCEPGRSRRAFARSRIAATAGCVRHEGAQPHSSWAGCHKRRRAERPAAVPCPARPCSPISSSDPLRSWSVGGGLKRPSDTPTRFEVAQ